MSTPNFLQMLHLRNIFGSGAPLGNDLPSQGGITGNMPAVPNAPTDLGQISTNEPSTENPFYKPDLSKTMNQDTLSGQINSSAPNNNPAFERLNKMLEQFPTRDKPSILRRIAAAGGALGGMNPDDILYPHFNEQMQDWKAKIGPATSAAQIERQTNTGTNTAAHQARADQLRQEALTARMANDSRRADIAESRAKVYDFKARHPEFKIVMPKGGNITAVNPQDPTQTIDLGVDTGTMTDEDRYEFTRDTTMKGIAAKGGEERKTAEAKGDIESGHITERGNQARITKTTPGANTSKTELPTQTRVRVMNRANQARIEHPEWASYITINGNEVKIKTPGRFSEPDKDTYKAISDYIEGNTTTPAPMEKEIPNHPGKMAVSNDGGKTWKAK